MEVIDLGLSDLDSISINLDDSAPSSGSMGPGIELLMNDKKKAPSGSMSVDLGELDKLENLSTILECAYCNTKNVLTFIPDQNEKIQFKCANCNNINSVLLQFTVARTTEPVEIGSILKQLS